MTTHSRILAWKTPWTEEPGKLQFMGLQKVRHDWETVHTQCSFSITSYTYHQYTLICTMLVYSGLHFSDDFMSSQFHQSVQSLSHIQLFATPWTQALQASLSITYSWTLLKLMSIASVRPSNHLILCHPLLLLPSIFHSIRVFSKSVLRLRWPKYWSFSFSISPSNEYSGLISFTIDWFDLADQGTVKSLLQHHSSKTSILGHSAFFMVQL